MGGHSGSTYILGLDLGPNSVGWAALDCDTATDEEPLRPVGVLGAGSRVFEAGVTGDMERGKEESLSVARRQARLARRGLDRRGRRQMVLYLRLAAAGLLPQVRPPGVGVGGNAATRRAARLEAAQARDQALKALDAELWERWSARIVPTGADKAERLRLGQVLPYALRAHALDEKLEPHELGRALYHLGQRRGFLSNRKAPKKDDEKQGAVEQGIGAIRLGMQETRSRTLGEYFFRCDPFVSRIRERYTSRDLYKDEFEAIWSAQVGHRNGLLTEGLKRQVERAIFHQRPLRNQKNLVGRCELEPKSHRAPIACLVFQHFRLLQQLNNSRLTAPDGIRRPFTPEERAALVEALTTRGDLTFTAAKDALKPFGVNRKWTFNFESGGESRFVGDRTSAKLRSVFGERWDEFTTEQKEAVLSDLLSIQRPETLVRRGVRVWGLSQAEAELLAAIELEEGHASLSRKALHKLVPYLDQWDTGRGQWTDVTNAKELAGYHTAPKAALKLLPPLNDAIKSRLIGEVRNPAVARTLTELRKVVNALVRRHGLPAAIRVELGRDLRNPRDRRERMWRDNRRREKARLVAAKLILKETRDEQPTRDDIEKVLLAEECGWQCPYTGQTITPASLLGPMPHFDVEHIIPFSSCLDDSFLNKTLCEVSENRNRKRNRSPWEAYGGDAQRWEAMLERVKSFKGDAARAKLERFRLEDTSTILADFTSRQLNDTRYASRLAREYLGLLYGGTTDADGTIRVQVAQGRITAALRGLYGLNAILRDGGVKDKRDDHRHHAVDAVAVALTGPRTVKRLSDAARDALQLQRRRYAPLQPLWEGFLEDVRSAIDGANVSHRPSHKVSGRLHEDTFYSAPKQGPDGKEYVHVRKRLNTLSPKDVDGIVDAHVQAAVRAKLDEIGSGDPAKLDLAKDPPVLRTKSGGTVPIRKARVRRPPTVFAIGSGAHRRHVVSDANHHAEIVEVTDAKGRSKWEGHIVPLHEAYRRLRARQPVVRRDHGPGKRFLFTLASGDMIELDSAHGGRKVFRVRSVSLMTQRTRQYVNVEYVRNNDARLKKDIKSSKQWSTSLVDPLRRLNCKKVTVTPLGEIRHAND
jgi:CRISPR-associated endonuclease Csn1